MAKTNAKYEVLYIIDTTLGEEAVQALVERFKGLVEEHGTLVELNEWGNRKLAYLIDDKPDGYYVLMTFDSDPDFPAELDRIFNITEGIMRSLIICLDE